MTVRASGLAALVSVVIASALAAQRTVDVGVFTRFTKFDNTLGMGHAFGLGARAALYLGPTLAVELDAAHASGNSIAYTPTHLRLVYAGSVSPSLEALIGGGYVRNWYGSPYGLSDGGLSALLGVRYRFSPRLWLRAGADLDFMIHTAEQSPFPFYHGNWGLHLGVETKLAGGH